MSNLGVRTHFDQLPLPSPTRFLRDKRQAGMISSKCYLFSSRTLNCPRTTHVLRLDPSQACICVKLFISVTCKALGTTTYCAAYCVQVSSAKSRNSVQVEMRGVSEVVREGHAQSPNRAGLHETRFQYYACNIMLVSGFAMRHSLL